jgi:hypothetical protein
MARCEECIHHECCVRFTGARTLICGDKADERCKLFKPTADVVEVVRCCDCKYCETVIHSIIDEPQWFCTRMVKTFDVDPTCFCSYGERKE